VRVLAIVHQRDSGAGIFAEAIREGGAVLDEWLLSEQAEPPADPLGYDAVFTLGGAMNVDEEDRHPWIGAEKALLAELIESGVPLLGLCLGGQLIASAAGATPGRAERPEIGWFGLQLTPEGGDDPLFGPLGSEFEAFEWHSYEFPLPPGAVPLARTDLCLQGFRLGELTWAIQFHPELVAADIHAWIDDYHADPDAVRLGLDWEALRAESDEKIGAFNRLGRDLCARWLEVAKQAVVLDGDGARG
jgi:GMP synthase-like glutamine amidotransferase